MECFTIMSQEIEGRIDPHFYIPEFRRIENSLKKSTIKLLGDIASFQYGLGETAKDKGDVVYIRITDINEFGNLKKESLAYLDFVPKYENYVLKKGDVLVARTGATFGKSFYFDENLKSVFAGYLIRIKLNKDIKLNSKYLFYFMQTEAYWLQARQIMTGGGQPQFNANTIAKLKIPLPPLETQNKIVSLMNKAYSSKKQKESETQKLLDSINDYVLDELGIKLPELKDKMIYVVNSEEVKNNRMDAYYYQPKFKEIEKAVNRGKFEVKELKEIVKKIKTGTTPHQTLEPFTENKEIIFLRNTNLYRNKIILDDVRYIKNQLSKNLTYSSKNDIIICIAGTLGLTAVNIFDERISINQNISSLTLNENVNPHFVSAILNLKIYDFLFKRVASLATIFYINNDNLLSLKIPLPSLPIQNKIAEEVKKRMQKAEQLQKEAKEELEKAKREVEKIILGE